ncbi:hypothetical protein ACXO5B_04960, partial [Lactobacillus delbrueckii subsp. bulgaricus]
SASVALPLSIHASHAGCDTDYQRFLNWFGLSIHASHAGCDIVVVHALLTSYTFNPRIPCGMRPLLWLHPLVDTSFNPRIPCGMRPQHLVKKAFSQLNIGHTKYKKH